MKITLAFTIYNKENWIESILRSWIENAANRKNLEIIIVFDDLKDNSEINAIKTLKSLNVDYLFLYADNMHEIFCNRLALSNSTGDYIIFIQDDNWMYDKYWDLVLEKVISHQKNTGIISLLASSKIVTYSLVIDYYIPLLKHWFRSKVCNKTENFSPIFRFKRLESNRSKKGENFDIHRIQSLPIAVWHVHLATRPFFVSKKTLQNLGGLDEVFMPHTADDIDLSLKCLSAGLTNLYIPFNLLNISTITDDIHHGSKYFQFLNGYSICFKRNSNLIKRIDEFKIKKCDYIKLKLNQQTDSLEIFD